MDRFPVLTVSPQSLAEILAECPSLSVVPDKHAPGDYCVTLDSGTVIARDVVAEIKTNYETHLKNWYSAMCEGAQKTLDPLHASAKMGDKRFDVIATLFLAKYSELEKMHDSRPRDEVFELGYQAMAFQKAEAHISPTDNERLVMMPDDVRNKLILISEQGMGYQVVKLQFADGSECDGVSVMNSEVAALDKKYDPDNIVGVTLSKVKRQSRTAMGPGGFSVGDRVKSMEGEGIIKGYSSEDADYKVEFDDGSTLGIPAEGLERVGSKRQALMENDQVVIQTDGGALDGKTGVIRFVSQGSDGTKYTVALDEMVEFAGKMVPEVELPESQVRKAMKRKAEEFKPGDKVFDVGGEQQGLPGTYEILTVVKMLEHGGVLIEYSSGVRQQYYPEDLKKVAVQKLGTAEKPATVSDLDQARRQAQAKKCSKHPDVIAVSGWIRDLPDEEIVRKNAVREDIFVCADCKVEAEKKGIPLIGNLIRQASMELKPGDKVKFAYGPEQKIYTGVIHEVGVPNRGVGRYASVIWDQTPDGRTDMKTPFAVPMNGMTKIDAQKKVAFDPQYRPDEQMEVDVAGGKWWAGWTKTAVTFRDNKNNSYVIKLQDDGTLDPTDPSYSKLPMGLAETINEKFGKDMPS